MGQLTAAATAGREAAMTLSVVIPVYNGAGTIGRLVETLVEHLSRRYELEIVLVNDGSRDDSHAVCQTLRQRYGSLVTYLRLAKNFGEHNSVLAGLNHVTGDYAVILDDDFQNPPEEIEKLIDTAVNGSYDVVYSYYTEKRHSWLRNLGSRFTNAVASSLLDKPRDLYLSSFKCLNRFLVREVVKYTGPYPYLDGLILRSTSSIGTVLVRHDPRTEGRSGYTLRKLVGLWLNMFVNFSILPLRMSTLLGFVFSGVGAFWSVWMVIEKLVNPGIPMGITSILVAVFTFAGIQLLIIGLIGEYLGKLFLSMNQTPQYVIREASADQEGMGEHAEGQRHQDQVSV